MNIVEQILVPGKNLHSKRDAEVTVEFERENQQ